MQVTYHQTPGPLGQLTHFTPTVASLESILAHGFLFIHNPTEIHHAVLDSLGVSYPDNERGMISFTVAEWNNCANIRRIFGNFGIAVDFNWALNHGAKQVAYIAKTGALFEALRTLVAEGLPRQSHWEATLGEDGRGLAGKSLIQELLANPDLHGAFSTALHTLTLELLLWVQTDEHAFENEYRIRAPRTIGGISQFMPREQIPLLSALSQHLNFQYALPIPKDALLFLSAPASHEEELHLLVEQTQYAGCPLRIYPEPA